MAIHVHTTTRRTLLGRMGAASVIGVTAAAAQATEQHKLEEPLVVLERRFLETDAVFDAAFDNAFEQPGLSIEEVDALCAAEREAHWAVWEEMAHTPPVGPAGVAVLARQWLHCVTGEGGGHHQEEFARALLTWATQQAEVSSLSGGEAA